MSPRYLGDAVYACVDEYNRVVLTTGSHEPRAADNVIVLEPEVVECLRRYLDEFAESGGGHA